MTTPNTRAPLVLVLLAALLVTSSTLLGCPEIEVPDDRCTTYCDKVIDTCGTIGAQATAQYINAAACKLYCNEAAELPSGNSGDQSGDSVECRIYHSGAATLDPTTHCEHAGPTGGAVCGGYCDNYCRLMEVNCGGKFATSEACMAACGAFAVTGAANETSGNTVQCRITHAGLAGAERGTAGAEASCALAMPDSQMCAPPADCDDFCALVTTSCVGEDAVYAGESDCNDVCDEWAGWREGSVGDSGANTVGCRHFQAEQAAESKDADAKEQFCKNASETGGGVCGSFCTNYCDLMGRNCAGSFATAPECMTACAAFSTDGDPTDLSGNTVQCRITFATAAGEPGVVEPELLCESAGPQSGPCN